MNTLATRIRERMDARQLSQEQLAAAAGLSQPAVHKLLAGKSRSTRHLPQLATVLRTSIDWLATGREPANHLLPDDIRIALYRLRHYSQSPEGRIAARAVNAILEDPARYEP